MQATLRGVARRPGLAALAVLVAHLVAAPAARVSASTEVVRDGVCVETWSAGDLVRGPTAIVSGALLPLRALLGGVVFAGLGAFREPTNTALAPLWIVGSTLYGVGQGVAWIATGALDTVSGGAFRLAPSEATELRVDPVVPFIGGDSSHGERCRAQASPVAIGTSSASPHSAHDPS